MLGRIVEIAEGGQFLSVSRGFLVVSEAREERARVPLDDLAALIGNSYSLIWTNNAFLALAERGVPVVLCGANHRPAAIVWPIEQHYLQAGRMRAQAGATPRLKKRLWRTIVRQKLAEQSAVLRAIGQPRRVLDRLVGKVRAGDPSNIEAQSARYYWPALFGKSFRRDADLDGINGLLNYAYAVLRAATARAIVAAGLHPSLGLFHRDPQNSFQLVDDLMEPFRPRMDMAVHEVWQEGQQEVDKETKRKLALAVYRDCATSAGRTPLIRCIELTAGSLAAAFSSGKTSLVFPNVLGEEHTYGAEETPPVPVPAA